MSCFVYKVAAGVRAKVFSRSLLLTTSTSMFENFLGLQFSFQFRKLKTSLSPWRRVDGITPSEENSCMSSMSLSSALIFYESLR